MTQEPESARERALSAARLPAIARETWTGRPPRPEACQIWRANWQGTATLVVITQVERTTLTTVAVTTTPDLADDHAVVVDPQHTYMDVPLVVWDRMAKKLPIRVLERCLGTLAPDWSTGFRPRPAQGAVDVRHQERAAVQDRLDDLAQASWAQTFEHSLTELLDQDDNRRLLLKIPNLTRDAQLSLRRGQRALTEEQAVQMSILSSIPSQDWLAAGPTLPDALVEAIDQPSERPRITRLASTLGLDEIAARREVAYKLYALAARETGTATENWSARLHHYLQAHEATT